MYMPGCTMVVYTIPTMVVSPPPWLHPTILPSPALRSCSSKLLGARTTRPWALRRRKGWVVASVPLPKVNPVSVGMSLRLETSALPGNKLSKIG